MQAKELVTPKYFDAMLTKYHERYIFAMGDVLREGVKIQTRGDDLNFPTFQTDDGKLYSVRADAVRVKVETESE